MARLAALALLLATTLAGPMPAMAQDGAPISVNVNMARVLRISAPAATVIVGNPGVADVYVASARQIHLFGKAFGEATVFATNAAGAVVYSATVRVSQNISSIDAMMKAAMPDSDITVTTVGQIAVLNGTVHSPQDSEQAQRLVTSLLNPAHFALHLEF